jgi:hypothetical protein
MSTSLSVSVSVAQFGAAVAVSSILATEIDYIELTSVGRTDTTGRFRYIEEIALIVDENSKELRKRLATDQGVDDQIANTLQKQTDDSFSLDDSQARVAEKSIDDPAVLVDLLAKILSQGLHDLAEPQDAPQLTPQKAAASSFELTDFLAHAAQKDLADSFALTDVVNTLLLYIRSLSDQVAATDRPYLLFLPPVLAEYTPVSDVALRTYSKSVSDGVAIDDGTSVGDGSTYNFQKSLNNIVFMLDTKIRAVTKASAEQITAPDSGFVFATNYCDITYFAEDFVGVSTTF